MDNISFNNRDSLPISSANNGQPASNDDGYILLTGASGLVGQYLLKDLYSKKQKLAVLIRPKKKLTGPQRVEAIMRRWEQQLGRNLPRPVVLEGDLASDSLNLSNDDQLWVRQHCNRIIHNAAILTFHGADRNEEPWKTNLHGTQNVLRFANESEIRELHYVSTAYVSGICDDKPFRESDFECGQDFRNDYERSKFEAESAVRNCDGFDSKTFYRPAVITGDSETGYTASYHGLYVYLRLMATLIPQQPPGNDGIRRTPIRLPMKGDEPRNLVPVDWVSSIISDLVCDRETHNQTYHLVPEKGLTAKELIDFCYEYFNSSGAQFCESAAPEYHDAQGEFARKYLENIKVYAQYDTSDPAFDDSNVKKQFPNRPCPAIDKQVVFRFLDFGIEDNWGKNKRVPVDSKNWIDVYLPDIQAASVYRSRDAQSKHITFGLDILGPGGGQWNISIDQDGEVAATLGIPIETIAVLEIDPAITETLTDNAACLDVWRKFLTRFSEFDFSAKKPLQLIA